MVKGDLKLDLSGHPHEQLVCHGRLFFLSMKFADPAVPGDALITPVGAEAVASATAVVGPGAEMPQTEAAARAKPEELPAVSAKRIPVSLHTKRFAHEFDLDPCEQRCRF